MQIANCNCHKLVSKQTDTNKNKQKMAVSDDFALNWKEGKAKLDNGLVRKSALQMQKLVNSMEVQPNQVFQQCKLFSVGKIKFGQSGCVGNYFLVKKLNP